MDRPNLFIIGSSNTDMVVKSAHLPAPGETVLGGDFLMNPGGKGANQAVAAARLGGQVQFLTRVGNDLFGREAVAGFQAQGIDTQYISTDPQVASGVALIMVDEKGENSISVALGANGRLQPAHIDPAKEAIGAAAYLLIQLEVPLPTVHYAIELAQSVQTPVVLNPAPAQVLSPQLLQGVAILTPNESEAELLTGIQVRDAVSAQLAAEALRKQGVDTVIITLGARGAFVHHAGGAQLVAAPEVQAVDTTAAGDTFNGALVVGLAEGMSTREAVQFANRAAAISVTRLGAQSSVPSRAELG